MTLKSGHEIPIVGMGTWPLKGDTCVRAVRAALEIGYRHLDSAWMYKNHVEVGQALAGSSVDREDVFITSKVWRTHLHHDGVMEQHAQTLRDLGVDAVDLFLVHWPDADTPMTETFRALSTLYAQGTARSIGVSNFSVSQLEKATRVSDAPLCVNQIKYNPGHQQTEILDWCKANSVVVTAYSPLAKGSIAPLAGEIASSIGRTPAHRGRAGGDSQLEQPCSSPGEFRCAGMVVA